MDNFTNKQNRNITNNFVFKCAFVYRTYIKAFTKIFNASKKPRDYLRGLVLKLIYLRINLISGDFYLIKNTV